MKKVLLSLISLGAVLGFALSSSSDDAEGVIFSHTTHIVDAGVDDCSACHETTVESSDSKDSLLPTMETCGACHDVEDEESCSMCHTNPEEPGTFALVEPTVLFNHSKHLGIEGVDCVGCHGSLDEDSYLVVGQSFMERCAECHDGTMAERACESCHISTDNLRPVTHDQTFAGAGHGVLVKLDGESSCLMCHDQQSCGDCHDPSRLVRSPEEQDLRTPYKSASEQSTEKRVLERVHDENYRFTHPLDAKSGASECTACHSYEQFCNECHHREAEGRRYKPASHSSPDWVMKTHAEMGRRDIGSCVSCHENPDHDPVCLACH